MIEISELRVAFDSVGAAVDGVSFSVPAGAAWGLVGESGCGKTTLLRAVAGLAAPDSGRVTLAGAPLTALDRRNRARRVQMGVPGPVGLVASAPDGRRRAGRALADPRRRRPASSGFRRRSSASASTPACASATPNQLSGGQRQRVAIARALMLAPATLLLDEPTASLDVSSQARILELLARLRRETGATMLFVGHDLAVVAGFCDIVMAMRAGRVVDTVPAARLRSGEGLHPYTQALVAASRG